MKTPSLFLIFQAFLVLPAYAQLGDAPLPSLKPVSGPTLEATQQWVMTMLKSLPGHGIQTTDSWRETTRWAASFKGCNYEYFIIERNERLRHADNRYAGLRWEIISGRLEDLISEQLPDGIAYIPIAQGKYVQKKEGHLSDLSKDLHRFHSLDESDLNLFRSNYDRSYTYDLHLYINVMDHVNSTRLVRAFLHMSKLCGAIKLEEKKPLKIVPPPGEPF